MAESGSTFKFELSPEKTHALFKEANKDTVEPVSLINKDLQSSNNKSAEQIKWIDVTTVGANQYVLLIRSDGTYFGHSENMHKLGSNEELHVLSSSDDSKGLIAYKSNHVLFYLLKIDESDQCEYEILHRKSF